MVSVVGVIPARGGSKSIPRKNIRVFLGKPLLAWTIEAARESGVFERLVLSTDDPAIAETGRRLGAEVPALRPKELAQDTSPTAPAVKHILQVLLQQGGVADIVVILEPTSPGRRPFHLREVVELMLSTGADSVASVSPIPHHYVPSKALELEPDGTLRGLDGTHMRDMVHRRQDVPSSFALNGIAYACRAGLLQGDPPTIWGTRVVGHVVDPKYSLDIDSPEDWLVAEARVRQILQDEEKRNSDG